MAYYLDTSALVKLVVAERETTALRSWALAEGRVLVSSDLARTELVRAVRRVRGDLAVRAREVLDSITLIRMTAAVFDEAGRLEPLSLRSLDAAHLAAALSLGDDLEGCVTYDAKLAEACKLQGVAVAAPA